MQTLDKMPSIDLNLTHKRQIEFTLESNENLYGYMLEIYNDKEKSNDLIYEYFYKCVSTMPIYKHAYAEWLVDLEDKNPKNYKNCLRFVNHIINTLVSIKSKLNSSGE